MNISTIINLLEELAPPSLQESYDNSGLIVGDRTSEVSGILVCLDSLEEIVEEAIERKCNLIVAHHPIVFSGLKSLTGKNYIERTIIKAIKNDISIYAIHTNLDNVKHGVNKKIADKIGLKNLEILSPKHSLLKKLVFFCPIKEAEKVRNEIFKAGAGEIGNYDSCSFNVEGTGTFKAGEGTKPTAGAIGQCHKESETRVETIVPNHKVSKVIDALVKNHPYEEVAYDLYPVSNSWNEVGSGMIGELETEKDTLEFLNHLKNVLNTESIRYTNPTEKMIKKVAVCGGSGSFLLDAAIQKKADILVTADFKYHQFFDADKKIVIADVGHYESEQFTMELLQGFLSEKIPNFAVHLTKNNTNPINYI